MANKPSPIQPSLFLTPGLQRIAGELDQNTASRAASDGKAGSLGNHTIVQISSSSCCCASKTTFAFKPASYADHKEIEASRKILSAAISDDLRTLGLPKAGTRMLNRIAKEQPVTLDHLKEANSRMVLMNHFRSQEKLQKWCLEKGLNPGRVVHLAVEAMVKFELDEQNLKRLTGKLIGKMLKESEKLKQENSEKTMDRLAKEIRDESNSINRTSSLQDAKASNSYSRGDASSPPPKSVGLPSPASGHPGAHNADEGPVLFHEVPAKIKESKHSIHNPPQIDSSSAIEPKVIFSANGKSVTDQNIRETITSKCRMHKIKNPQIIAQLTQAIINRILKTENSTPVDARLDIELGRVTDSLQLIHPRADLQFSLTGLQAISAGDAEYNRILQSAGKTSPSNSN